MKLSVTARDQTCCLVHHFGQEEEESQRQLFVELVRNLYLGQWEIASACHEHLCKQRKHHGKSVHLQTLLCDHCVKIPQAYSSTTGRSTISPNEGNSLGISIGSRSVPSPHHLSWLCLMNLKKTGFEMTQYGDAVQFRLMLEQTHECEPSAAIIKEIYDCYSSFHGVSAATNASPSRLSEESLSLIERIIDRDIILGHQIICRLTAQQTQVVHNAALQHVYLRCMRRHLALINRAQTGISGDSAAVNPSFSFVCKLLSLLNAEVARSCSEPVCELFEEVLDATERVGESSLAHRPIADDVCAALLRVDDSFLVDEYLKLEDERFGRCPPQRARTTTELTRRSSGEDNPNVASASLVSWREIFLSCLRGKTHFLEDVLLNCLESVLRHDYEALRHLLAPPAFSRLRPLVVLLSWRMCDDVSNLTKLIKTIWPPDETPPLTDASLQRGVDRLSNELEVINWCMSKIRTSKLPVATDTYQRAQNLLHCMEDNSVLYVLHYMGMIGRVPHRDIYELLREKRASVTMAEADAGVSIYSAFCAVQAVMDAIFHSTAIEHKIQAEFRRSRRNSENCKSDLCKSVSHESQDCERTRSACVGIDTSGSKVRYDEMDMQAQARDEYQQLYTKHVMMALQCARSAITAVNPLAYRRVHSQFSRLETLENIFSLLFVRYKDLHDSVLPPGDATEEGGNGDEERSRRSFETSLDSIVFEQHLSVSEKQVAPATLTVEQHSQANSSDSTGEHTATTSADVHAGPGGGGGATDQCFLPLNDERSSEGDCQGAPYVGYSSSRSVSSLNGYSTGFLCNALLARDLLHLLKDCVDELKVTETTRSQQPAPSRPSERERPQAPTKPELVTDSERAPPQEPNEPAFVTYSERAPLQEPNEPAFVTHSERAPPQEPNEPALVTHSEGAPPQMPSESALDAGMKTASRDVISPTLSTPLKDSTLQARLSCLSRLVSEALWRYRLVTDSGIPDAVGVISISEPRLERSDDGEEDEEAEEWTKPRYRRRHKHAGVINAHSSSSASKSASQDGESQSGGQDGGRRTRRKSLRRQRGSHRNLQPRNSIVSEMLASRETLLNVCLLKGNYLQAKQVIKMCDMDEHPAVYEVGFLEHQEMAARKIMNAEMRHKATQLQGDNYSGKDSVSSIARVAASGLAVTLISRVAEELLHHSTPCVSLTHHQAAALLSLGVFRAGEEPAMVVADLGVASSGTHDGSLRLLDLATRKLSAAGSLQTSGGGGGGNATFSGFLARLVALGGALDGRRSVAHALTCGTFSPHAEMRRHQVAVVDGLQQWGRAALACLHRGVATRRGGEPSDDARSLQRPGKQLFRRFRRTRHQARDSIHDIVRRCSYGSSGCGNVSSNSSRNTGIAIAVAVVATSVVVLAVIWV
ncbi:PREDICTED: uncharacterized protein LOC106808815 [Priapulus caudatus]|uniref:Uncharacterized protein LOC106808815 n=1 Tax=Priapulus caudatus TaxID=37621 RepID=A0ABM1E4P1_PRICU|nr:PREDICTED: uncharacterized protein LOC106808815 [Priapulus caudatus]